MKPPFRWSGLERLSIYDRYLRRFEEKQIETVSSSTLAKAAGVYPAQLWKDWGYLGSSGTRGLGFPVSELLVAIREDLRRESLQPVILVAVGNLGAALLRYDGFQKEGFEVIGAFDAVPEAVVLRVIEVPIEEQKKLLPMKNTTRSQLIRGLRPPPHSCVAGRFRFPSKTPVGLR